MRKWLLRGAIALVILIAILAGAGWYAAQRFEPYIREQAVSYLENRFGTGVELGSLHVSVRYLSPWKWRSSRLVLSGESLKLPNKGRAGLPPLIAATSFSVQTELGAIWDSPRRIHDVRLHKLEINIPPREDRPQQAKATTPPPPAPAPAPTSAPGKPAVVVDTIHADGIDLRIFPADPAKLPRLFEIHHLTLKGTAPGLPLKYDATLTNPRPRGTIQVAGNFGPWFTDDPGQTPISGEYTFRDADLGVFKSIAGILNSTGKFDGVLRRIEVRGETRAPEFRLAGGNPVPLTTTFHSIVDGTSGDTFLEPVRATLGSSTMEARGKVVRPPGVKARSIVLNVVLPKGRVEDLVRLAVKSPKPFLNGDVALKTKLQILPAPGQDLSDRLLLDGDFAIEQAQFVGGSVQDKIDELSRRAQGQPKNEAISDVLSAMRGEFSLRDGDLKFADLVFHAPGAGIHLHGNYGLESEQIDLHGVARLQAKVSQTVSGWKRIMLKPVDPFLSKAGAGTLLPIQITGSRSAPKFGLDRKRDDTASADRVAK
jgi:hypothetical protein